MSLHGAEYGAPGVESELWDGHRCEGHRRGIHRVLVAGLPGKLTSEGEWMGR